MRRTLHGAGVLLIVWSIPALCNVGMELVVDHRLGRMETFWQLVGGTALPWYVWAPATPIITRVSRRFPVRRPRDVGHLAVHMIMSIVMTVVFVALMRALQPAIGLPGPDESVWQFAADWSAFTVLAYAAVTAAAHANLFAVEAHAEALQRAVFGEQLTRAQLNTLRMQLHPQFLFNALNTIAMLVREQDATTAVRLIAELGALLRELLRDPGALEVALADELDLISRYLGIEQIRFGARLAVTWDIDPGVLDAVVPPLILQPLVENAVRNGIERCATTATIAVHAAAISDSLVLTVSDSGPTGVPMYSPADIAGNQGAGLELANTRERLRRMYREHASLRLERTSGGCTVATLQLPFTRIADALATATPGHEGGHAAAGRRFAGEPMWHSGWKSS